MRNYQKFILQAPKAPAYIENSTNCNYITLVQAISADGSSPMIVQNATDHREQWSPSGVKVNWIEHSDKCTSARQHGEYRLILFEAHESHTTLEFITLCNKKKIIPLNIPPRTTNLLLPLNRRSQPPPNSELDEQGRPICASFNQTEFLRYVRAIQDEALTHDIIMNSWRSAGLIPYNPSAVLESLEHEEEAEEEPQGNTNLDHPRLYTPSESEFESGSESSDTSTESIRTLTLRDQRYVLIEEKPTLMLENSLSSMRMATKLLEDIAAVRARVQRRRQLRRERRRILQSGSPRRTTR